MADNFEDGLYDDEEAVRFIQSHIPQELQGKYTDDDIILITDTVADFYERNGWLNSNEEIDIDIVEVANFVAKECKKDKDCHFDTDPESIRWIVEAEMDYEDSLA